MNSTFSGSEKIVMITASAGSGKTYTLARTVVEILDNNPNISVSQILLITFTNKAVEEMEKTVFQMISEKHATSGGDKITRWKQAIADFNNNSIMTFDSFFSSIVRDYGFLLGVDPQFSILNEFQKNKIRDKVNKELREKIERSIRENSEFLNFSSLRWQKTIQAFSNIQLFLDYVLYMAGGGEKTSKYLHLIKRYFSLPAGELWQLFRENIFLPWLKQKISPDIDLLKNLIPDIKHYSTIPVNGKSHENAQKILIEILECLENRQDSHIKIIQLFLTPNLRKPRGKNTDENFIKLIEQIQQIRKEYFDKKVRDFYKAIIEPFPPSSWQYWIDLISVAGTASNYVSQHLSELKKMSGMFEFDDIRSWCRSLLFSQNSGNANFGKVLKNKFKYVFIDEFQDTAPSQLEIVSKIFGLTDHNIFLVGDEKQSIYRFRGAEVRLTRQVKKTITNLSRDKYTISTLNNNFRSFSDLIEYLNFTFLRVFPPLHEGRDYYAEYGKQDFPKELLKENSQHNFRPWEAAKLNHRIENLKEPVHAYLDFFNFENPGLVAESITRQVEKILNSDQAQQFLRGKNNYPLIGILLPTTKLLPELEELFDKKNIPYTMYAKGFYQTSEIVALLNLLRFWNNPNNIYSITALLRSDLIGVPENKISPLLISFGNHREPLSNISLRDKKLHDKLIKWLDWGKTLPVKDALWKVLNHSPFKATLFEGQHQRERIANINKFIREIPEGSLTDTLFVLEKLIKDTTIDKEFISARNPVVVMTIHKSKGLKFQHVITLTPTLKDMSSRGHKWMQAGFDKVAEDAGNYYFSAPRFYPENNSFELEPNLLNTICSLNEREEALEEKRRLVYVAHTRAVQGLSIFNPLPSESELSAAINRSTPINVLLWEIINNQLNDEVKNKNVAFNNNEFLNIFYLDRDILPEEKGVAANSISEFPKQIFWPETGKPREIKFKIKASQLYELKETQGQTDNRIPNISDITISSENQNFGTEFHHFMEKNISAVALNQLNMDTISEPRIKEHLQNITDLIQTNFSKGFAYPEVELHLSLKRNYENIVYEIIIDGIADLIVDIPGEGLFLIDYKTGRKQIEKHALQLAVYRAILKKTYKTDILKSGLLYSSPGVEGTRLLYVDEFPSFRNFSLNAFVDSFVRENHSSIMDQL